MVRAKVTARTKATVLSCVDGMEYDDTGENTGGGGRGEGERDEGVGGGARG